jgi:alkanesulfonate monooxygenase SsuD/methylene tetrahydromethanopterin reductase-like flavin-dependent oxidoreductase (luciferase family)
VGIFDWIDDARADPAEAYERRMRMVEFAEQAGYARYHVAEHHGTPLGMAASPNILLAAVAVRTNRIRLGPLVTLPPIFHPLRQLEETAMLDHLSRGRYDLGVGRGAVGYELSYFGVDAADTRAMLDESLEILIQGFTSGRVDHSGKYFTVHDYTAQIPIRQKPYPPLWYATGNADTAPWLGQHGIHAVTWGLGPNGVENSATFLARYVAALAEHAGDAGRLNAHVTSPRYGCMQHVYVADTDAQARREAGEALKVWYDNFQFLWLRHTGKSIIPFDLDGWIDDGFVSVGSPMTVRQQVQRLVDTTGANFLDGAFVFGSLSTEQALHSLDLFAREVRPALSR